MKTVALITLYYPSEENLKNVRAISLQVDLAIVCDNSPHSCKERFSEIENLIYVHDGKNRGLSNAFNSVLKDKQYDWRDEDFVVFFDQDSSIQPSHIAILLNEFQNAEKQYSFIGCIGPSIFNKNRASMEKSIHRREITKDIISVREIITSSLCCRYGVLRSIGFWNEKLFLDLADWDICWRMQKAGYACCITKKLKMDHTIGICEKKVCGVKIRVGAPIREYYQIRDCLYLASEDYVPIACKVKFRIKVVIRTMVHLAFLQNKRERLEYVLLGMKDFFRNKHGEFEKTEHRNI